MPVKDGMFNPNIPLRVEEILFYTLLFLHEKNAPLFTLKIYFFYTILFLHEICVEKVKKSYINIVKNACGKRECRINKTPTPYFIRNTLYFSDTIKLSVLYAKVSSKGSNNGEFYW